MQRNSNRENREIPSVSESLDSERSVNVSDGKTDMHADGKSHESVVPATTANNGAAEAPAAGTASMRVPALGMREC